MSDLDLGALKALAEAANSGPWRSRDNLDVYAPSLRELPRGETQDDTICQTLEANDAEFIAAANPQVVLALIERVQAAEAERDELKMTLTELQPSSPVWRAERAAENAKREADRQLARAERAEAALSGLMEQRVTRWACVVVESGYHNGARCTPDEPHADWGCGYRVALDNHGALHILSTYEKGATQ